jgi:hypothetical protein
MHETSSMNTAPTSLQAPPVNNNNKRNNLPVFHLKLRETSGTVLIFLNERSRTTSELD